MASICTSNVTSGFIDLATFDEIEKYLYGGPDATAYFVRETRKATWFTQVPVVLSRASGTPAFGQEWSVQISRAGDYLLQTWLRLQTPAVTLLTANQFGTNGRLRWTRNFMHNIVRECCLTFNDLVAARFDNYHLDFWAAFTVPAGKQIGYANMIGNTDDLTSEYAPGSSIPSAILNLPLPFFYSRDSGVALPTAALPYNDMRINFSFRNWSELLVLENPAASGSVASSYRVVPVVGQDIPSTPELGTTNVWANYAIVSNDERKRMACAPRDILIEQVQTAPRQNFSTTANGANYDIRFSHAIKVLFFAVRNTTFSNEWSNYTTASPVAGFTLCNFNPILAYDPIDNTSLIYENTNRLAAMGSDYFSLVNPYYCAPVIPIDTGYHMYSYSLDFISLDPMGSTNYGKLTNVMLVPVPSKSAVSGAAGQGIPSSGQAYPQSFEFVVTCVNNNIIRVSGGALGFKGKPKTGRCFNGCMVTIKDKHCKPYISYNMISTAA
uniref:Major capsid protein N-terminal domain-containing protein n=1 Tax=viral metagenome TaxID=1070528 RepID=A0A6C0CYS9_9ZZZZ